MIRGKESPRTVLKKIININLSVRISHQSQPQSSSPQVHSFPCTQLFNSCPSSSPTPEPIPHQSPPIASSPQVHSYYPTFLFNSCTSNPPTLEPISQDLSISPIHPLFLQMSPTLPSQPPTHTHLSVTPTPYPHNHPLTLICQSHQLLTHHNHPLTLVCQSHQLLTHHNHPLTLVCQSHQFLTHHNHPLTLIHHT